MTDRARTMGLEPEMAAPLHLQRLERSLNVQPFLSQVNALFHDQIRYCLLHFVIYCIVLLWIRLFTCFLCLQWRGWVFWRRIGWIGYWSQWVDIAERWFVVYFQFKIPLLPCGNTYILSCLVEERNNKLRLYNMSNVGEERRWLQDILLSDGSDTSSSESDSDSSITEEDFQEMLKFHMLKKKYQAKFYQKPEVKLCPSRYLLLN